MNGEGRSRVQRALIIAGLLLLAFFIGFLPQWLRARSLQSELRVAQEEVTTLDLGARLGAALAEAQRGNYERSRQLMADFFRDLDGRRPNIENAEQRREIDAIMSERDELITQLSRAEPEATSRLNLMYTRYFASFHPTGRTAPAAVTPPPPASTPTPP